MFLFKLDRDMFLASKKRSGAINSVINSSESISKNGVEGIINHATPSAICTMGVETFGMKRLAIFRQIILKLF